MIVRFYLTVIFLFILGQLPAQNETANYYWVAFTDKSETPFSVLKPEKFLSPRAISRREKQQIPIDELDLPVNPVYLSALKNAGAQVRHSSKWLNGATIFATTAQIESISTLPFVRQVQLTKPGVVLKSTGNKFWKEQITDEIDSIYYGTSVFQIGQLNGQFLHNNGFRGQGILIGILDAGFYRVNELPAFETLSHENRILNTHDFVNPGNSVFEEDDHGMNVLSIMAGNLPGELIGTAPAATYCLLRSEDVATEYLIEEDNWVVAAEYADSLGVDVINSSLGYSVFDDSQMSHSYTDMDGNTTRVTRAANIATQKGMLIFTSAGNEANDPWRYLVAPSDGDLVVGVGAVNSEGIWAPFSSLGPSSDGDVKPNVAALGWGTVLQKKDGSIGFGSGTSFSSPVVAGMAACLWQANPFSTSADVKKAIEMSAGQYANPDSLLGYGIPDFQLADQLLKQQKGIENQQWVAIPNPVKTHVRLINMTEHSDQDVRVQLFQTNGSLVYEKLFPAGSPVFIPNLSNLPVGMYVAGILCGNQQSHVKLIKSVR